MKDFVISKESKSYFIYGKSSWDEVTGFVQAKADFGSVVVGSLHGAKPFSSVSAGLNYVENHNMDDYLICECQTKILNIVKSKGKLDKDPIEKELINNQREILHTSKKEQDFSKLQEQIAQYKELLRNNNLIDPFLEPKKQKNIL